jgi:hypothetical protein
MPDPALILYEGQEDKSCLKALLEARGIMQAFTFHHECGGNTGFKKQLDGLIAGTGLEKRKAIIVIGDNDGNYTTSFNAIKSQIRDAGFNTPSNPRELVSTNGLPPISVLMIPWDNDPGCLETLFLSAINNQYARQLACADGLIDCVHADSWDIAKRSKLRMRGFLSAVCTADPNTGLRYAFSPHRGTPLDIFDLNHSSFNNIVTYLQTFL